MNLGSDGKENEIMIKIQSVIPMGSPKNPLITVIPSPSGK